ncbi:MAG: TspO/MBR family protein [Patescibacteria group bacterium]
MKINNTFKLIISLLIPQVAGGLGSYFTINSVKDWYPVLVKPALNPPSWIFGPVWTTLFLLMGYALYLVWKDGSGKSKRLAYWAFGIQMVLNTLWSIIFFGLHSPGGALFEMIFLWLAILATIVAFAKISPPSSGIWTTAGRGKLAAWLLVPYIFWVSFAGYLNYAIWALN